MVVINLSGFVCETCVMVKSHRTIFYSNDNKAKALFSLLHSNVWGLASFSTHNEIRWFITFIDDCIRMTWVYLLRHKSDVCVVFLYFHKMVLTQFDISIKVICSNNGVEYFKRELTGFIHSTGILHQTFCPYSSLTKWDS